MVKISVLYPSQKDTRFDIDYYCNRHVPLVRQLLGPALKGGSVDYEISGEEPGSAAPYLAMGHLLFDSVAAFQTAFAPHTPLLLLRMTKGFVATACYLLLLRN